MWYEWKKEVVDFWVFSAGVDGSWYWIGASSADVQMLCICGSFRCLLFDVAGATLYIPPFRREKRDLEDFL